MKITLIAAMSNNLCIGYKNTIPWHSKSDLKHFKDVTMGKPVIMGRKTSKSIGSPLTGRKNIVMSRSTKINSVEAALKAAGDVDEVMVIGGSEIYELFLPMADKLIITHFDIDVYGDAFFPESNDFLEVDSFKLDPDPLAHWVTIYKRGE